MRYRSFFDVPVDADPFTVAAGQFRTWIREKAQDTRSQIEVFDWDGPGVHDLGEGARVTEIAERQEDGSQLLRLVLDEANASGRWMTQATVGMRPRSDPWSRFIWIETWQAIGGDDERQVSAQPPRLVRNILSEVDGINGTANLTALPRVVRGDDPRDTDELVAILSDGTRFVPVIVAGSLDGGDTWVPWKDAISDLVRPGIGVISAVILDPSARTALNDRLGENHSVAAGGVRTFSPGVVAGERSDAIRHRFITRRTLADAIDRDGSGNVRVRGSLSRALASNARRAVLGAALPQPIRRVDQILRAAERRTRFKVASRDHERWSDSAAASLATASAAPVARTPELITSEDAALVASLAGIHAMVRAVMDADVVTADHVQKFAEIISALSRDFSTLEAENAAYENVLDGAGRESEELRTQVVELESRVEEIELDAAVAEEELRRSENERRWLRGQLAASQRYDVLTAPREQAPPSNLAELIDRLLDTSGDGKHPLLGHVVFTGSRDLTEDLMGYDTLGRIAGKTWDVLLLLGDYAEVRTTGEVANLYAYITNPPVGRRAVPTGWFAPTESDAVINNRRWRNQRVFPVPTSIDPSGEIFMGAHFRLGGGDTVSPRLHLHDAVHVDGKIYVGYIGRHLPNAQTQRT